MLSLSLNNMLEFANNLFCCTHYQEVSSSMATTTTTTTITARPKLLDLDGRRSCQKWLCDDRHYVRRTSFDQRWCKSYDFYIRGIWLSNQDDDAAPSAFEKQQSFACCYQQSHLADLLKVRRRNASFSNSCDGGFSVVLFCIISLLVRKPMVDPKVVVVVVSPIEFPYSYLKFRIPCLDRKSKCSPHLPAQPPRHCAVFRSDPFLTFLTCQWFSCTVFMPVMPTPLIWPLPRLDFWKRWRENLLVWPRVPRNLLPLPVSWRTL
jgi:hypothetical protein